MTSYSYLEDSFLDDDVIMENYIKEYDKTVMPIPDIEFEPYILLNKVRKHYMEYVIKLLSVNYERNLRIPSNSLYRLPSAIWRCAKGIEMSAAQASMVLQIYRRNILSVVEELKKDTMAGKLNKTLYNCLYKRPQNEKRTQTTFVSSRDCNCQCSCNLRKKVKKTMNSSNNEATIESLKSQDTAFTIPQSRNPVDQGVQCKVDMKINYEKPNFPTKPVEEHPDELVKQLQKIFEGDENDFDIFDAVLCDESQDESAVNCKAMQVVAEKNNSILEIQSAQNNSLDERLVSLADVINTTVPEEPEIPIQKPKKCITSKWLCEEYFLKIKLLDLMDHIRDSNRNRLKGIKQLFMNLFGDDDDEEDLMSPINETPEFVLSCKERIAPWVVKVLTPYYIKGRIKGKALFKALAKHLIKLIYQCSQYPEEYEVHSFVSDFLKTHKMIRCEADFKKFKIINYNI